MPANPWVYPAGSAAEGPWDVSLGTHDSSLRIDGWQHTGLKTATFPADGRPLVLEAAAEERIVIPLTGDVRAVVGPATPADASASADAPAHDAAPAASEETPTEYHLTGRESVFHGAADVLYTGVHRRLELSGKPGVRVAIATAPARESYPTRLIRREEGPVELRGAGTCSREVHNFGTPAALEADRFIVCEVLTPAGNWSSYPPHKHDEEKDGETRLEEIYYFETRPTPDAPEQARDAVGYQRVYASDERPIDVNAEVRTGDVVLVPYGWHGPAMAPPGYDLYYLNVMAGPGPVREWLISDDPHHGWVRQQWEGQQMDPRLPFGS